MSVLYTELHRMLIKSTLLAWAKSSVLLILVTVYIPVSKECQLIKSTLLGLRDSVLLNTVTVFISMSPLTTPRQPPHGSDHISRQDLPRTPKKWARYSLYTAGLGYTDSPHHINECIGKEAMLVN